MVHQAQGQFVQEPAPPSRYVLREKDRPTRGCAAPELHFPTVDVRRLAEPGDTDERGRQASGARCPSPAGFSRMCQHELLHEINCQVTGHGMPEALLDDVREVAREFFHLPSKEKLKYANQTEGGEFQNEGYGTDRVDTDELILDWCDRLYLQVQPEDARQLRLWPDHPPSLGRLLHEYTLRSEQVATGQASSQVLALKQSRADSDSRVQTKLLT